MKITVDFAKVLWIIVAVAMAVLGLVSWWVVLLIVLYGIEFKYTFSS